MDDSHRFFVRRRMLAATGLAVAGVSCFPQAAWGQSEGWPNKSLRVIVNFPPGSSPDVLARAVSLPLQQAWASPLSLKTAPEPAA